MEEAHREYIHIYILYICHIDIVYNYIYIIYIIYINDLESTGPWRPPWPRNERFFSALCSVNVSIHEGIGIPAARRGPCEACGKGVLKEGLKGVPGGVADRGGNAWKSAGAVACLA